MAENPVHGEAEWMNDAEKRQHYSPKINSGLWISDQYRLSQKESNANIATLGVTGAGKSQGLGFRNILNLTGSAVITDLSGEYYRHTSGHLAERGYNIQVFNPTDLLRSLRFNPLLRLKTHQEKKYLANTIAMRMNNDNEPIWGTLAAELIFLTIHALSEYAKLNPRNTRYNTLANVLWVISHILSHREAVNHFFAEALADDPYSLAKYSSFIAKDEKIISGTITTAEASLDLFTDPSIRRLTATDNICLDPGILRKQPTVTYIIIPEHLTDYYGLILNLLYTCLIDELMRTPLKESDLPIMFLMDEFPAMGKLNGFERVATTLRKRNASIHMIFQSWAQLESVYGKANAETILEGGVGTKIFLPGLGLRTAEWLEKSLGYRTVYDSKHGGVDQHTIREALMSADKIRMLQDEHAIIVTGNKKPIKTKVPHAYKTELKELLNKPPTPLPFASDNEPEHLLPLDSPNLSGLGQIITDSQQAVESGFATVRSTVSKQGATV